MLRLTVLLVLLAVPVAIKATLDLVEEAMTAAHAHTVQVVAIASASSTIGDIAAVVAALAAVGAVRYARKTVQEARAALREESEAHQEEMAQQAHLLAATTAAHEQEMASRARALTSDLVRQRLAQLDRIADLLRDAADIGRHEEQYPPLRPDIGSPRTLSRIPGVLARLEVAAIVFERLGGPQLTASLKVATENRATPHAPAKVTGDAMSALQVLSDLAQNHEALKLPAL